jgi:hypothetical protein
MKKLKLTAFDADDLSVISAAVQDSLVVVRDCAFFADESRFVLLLNRFCWEVEAPAAENRPGHRGGHGTEYWRTHSALVFNAVRQVHHHRIPQHDVDRILELLTVDRSPSGSVVLRFAADRAIRLEIDRLACHLGDVGEPWPTLWKPAHSAD